MGEHSAEKDVLIWECGPHANAWNGHDARCRRVPRDGDERAANAHVAAPVEPTWPVCSTYPNLECVCRGALQSNKATCTRKRTNDLTPVRRAAPPTEATS